METISWEDRDGTRWIELEGELDHDDCAELKQRLDELTDGAEGDVVLVLAGVSFMGSMAIGVLLNQHSKLKKQGRALRLTGIRPTIRTVLDSMHLLQVFLEVES